MLHEETLQSGDEAVERSDGRAKVCEQRDELTVRHDERRIRRALHSARRQALLLGVLVVARRALTRVERVHLIGALHVSDSVGVLHRAALLLLRQQLL